MFWEMLRVRQYRLKENTMVPHRSRHNLLVRMITGAFVDRVPEHLSEYMVLDGREKQLEAAGALV